jgi:UDP-glucose 4-epimerase
MRQRQRTALVTGGAGFIGSHVADRLAQEGYRVVIVDNLSTGRRENVNERATLHAIDLQDPALAQVFEEEKPQVVFHLAAQASVARSMADPAADVRINLLGALNLLEQCQRHGVERFVYSSTGGALYGEPETIPCPETHPVRPLSVYGASKYGVEKYLHVYSVLGGFPYTVLRYSNVYGPRQDPYGEAGVIAIFTQRMLEGKEVVIFGDGLQERDFVYVGDVVEANIRALDQGDRTDIYNIGTGAGASVREVFDSLAAAIGYKKEPRYDVKRPGDVYRIYLDATKAREKLGWTPKVDLATGLDLTVQAMTARAGR